MVVGAAYDIAKNSSVITSGTLEKKKKNHLRNAIINLILSLSPFNIVFVHKIFTNCGIKATGILYLMKF